jgi:hypothetical protein
MKPIGKIKQAVPRFDKIRIIALHAAKVIGDLRRYTAVDIPE